MTVPTITPLPAMTPVPAMMPVPTRDVFGVFGPAGVLVALGMCGLAVLLVVAALNLWVRYQHSRLRREPESDKNAVEACPAYRRYLVAAAWSSGSVRDWDHSVRPVVGELVELAMAEHEPGTDPGQAARTLLGEQTWRLLDRDSPRSDDRTTPGPGRATLQTILDHVEKK